MFLSAEVLNAVASSSKSYDCWERIVLPILLSFAAAVIFWYFFNCIPHKRRYNKLRPRVEYDIADIYSKLLFYFDCVFECRPYSPPAYQDKILYGELTELDFELWLQNKCANESCLYDENSDKLIPIGRKMQEIADETDESVERLMKFSEIMDADEILLLRKIVVKMHMYNFDNSLCIPNGFVQLYPVNPNLSYISRNLAEIYGMYLKLRDLVHGFEQNGTDDSSCKIIYEKAKLQYHRGQYEKCIESTRNASCEKASRLLRSLEFQCEYIRGRKNRAIEILKKLLEDHDVKIVNMRGMLEVCRDDEEIIGILVASRTQNEVDQWKNIMIEEDEIVRETIEQNVVLKKFYEAKISGYTAKNLSST